MPDSVKVATQVDDVRSASAKMAAHHQMVAILLSLQPVNDLLPSQRSHNRNQGLPSQETVGVMGKSRQLLGSFWLPGKPRFLVFAFLYPAWRIEDDSDSKQTLVGRLL